MCKTVGYDFDGKNPLFQNKFELPYSSDFLVFDGYDGNTFDEYLKCRVLLLLPPYHPLRC